MLPLASGDDAAAVMWLDINNQNAKYANLYASHKVFAEAAAERALAKQSVADRLNHRRTDVERSSAIDD